MNEVGRSGGVGRRVGAVCFGVVLALLLTEIVFRLAGLGAPSVPKCLLESADDPSVTYHCFPSNPSGEFQPVPDVSSGRWKLTQLLSPTVEAPLSALTDTPWCVEYRQESLGVRGAGVGAHPSPGVTRFAGIGDSFALGEGVPVEKTLFAHLQGLLGSRVEFLNCGESGANAALNVERLEWMATTYDCPRALVIYNLNDVELTAAMREPLDGAYDLVNLRAAQLGPSGAARPWYQRVFRVTAYLAETSAVRDVTSATVRSYLDAYDPAMNADNLSALSAQFRRMASYRDVGVGLVVYPMMFRLDDYPLQPCHDQVVKLAREAGLPVLDLAASVHETSR